MISNVVMRHLADSALGEPTYNVKILTKPSVEVAARGKQKKLNGWLCKRGNRLLKGTSEFLKIGYALV